MKKALIPIGIVLAAVVGAGYFSMRAMRGGTPDGGLNAGNSLTVSKADIAVTVVDTGTIDASKAVELKSRVSGRLARLLVDEGDFVDKGQLVAVIDPQETELMVQQNTAQLRGAQSAVQRASLEIDQRKVTAQAAYRQAQTRLAQLQLELEAQPKLTRAAIQSAQTALSTARQERQRLLQSAHPTQKTQYANALRESEANLANAEREYQRQADLEAKGYVAGRDVESAKLTLDLARVRLETAQENLAKLEAQHRIELTKVDESIRQAQSDLTRAQTNAIQDRLKAQEVESARADVAKAKAALSDPAILAKQREQSMATVAQLSSVVSDSRRQLGETEVRAPLAGVVTKKMLEVGELASGLSGFSSGTPIIRIEDRRSMLVRLNVNEIDVAKLKVGMPAKIEVDALPDAPLSGTVVKISPASDATGNAQASADSVVRYRVEISLKDPSGRLRSGMSAKCTMEVVRKNDVIVMPIEYLTKEDDGSFVSVVTSAKGAPVKTEKRKVQVGASTGAKVEIASGLQVGQVVKKPEYTGPKRQGMMGGPESE